MIDRDSLGLQVVRKLNREPMTAGSIGEALEIDIGEVASVLRVLERRGDVTSFVREALIYWRLK